MKKLLLFAVFFFYGGSVTMAQKIDTLYYDNHWKGVENSLFAEYIRIVYTSKDSKYPNKVKDFWKTGELQGESGFISIDKYDDKKSIFSGEQIQYYKSGGIKAIGTLVNGKEEGKVSLFYENGAPQSVLFVENGIPNGKRQDFYENGGIKSSASIINGKTSGLVEMFYPNGKLASTAQWEEDLPNGEVSFYAEDGRHIRTLNMENGVINGKVKESYLKVDSDANGFAIVNEEDYLNGNIVEYVVRNGHFDYSRIDLTTPNGELIVSYNADGEILGATMPTKEHLKTMKRQDGVEVQFYEMNGLVLGGTFVYDHNSLVDSEMKSYAIHVFIENKGLYPIECHLSDVNLQFVKKGKVVSATICEPNKILETTVSKLQEQIAAMYADAETIANNAASVITSGSNVQRSSSFSFGNVAGKSGTVSGAVNNYGGAAIGGSSSSGSLLGYGSSSGNQHSSTRTQTIDGHVRHQVLQEESVKADMRVQEMEEELSAFANSLYGDMIILRQQPQWRSIFVHFYNADILRATITINDIPYTFEWSVASNKKERAPK